MSKILIVEDEAALLRSLSDELKLSGYETFEAKDGEEGLKMALEKDDLDLIILDLAMPKMNGMDVLKNIRENPSKAGLPVIILTNLDADNKIIGQIPDLNPSFYLMKHSMTPEVLLAKVEECLLKEKKGLSESSEFQV